MAKNVSFSPAEFADEGGANEDAQTQQDYRAFQEWLNSQAPATSASVPTPPTAPSTAPAPAETVATSVETVVAEAPSGSSGPTDPAVVTSPSEETRYTHPYLGSTLKPDPDAKCAICLKTAENCYSICSSVLFFCLVLYVVFLHGFKNNIITVQTVQYSKDPLHSHRSFNTKVLARQRFWS